ncbi:MAG: nucleotidyl transferase AbiEii/AbiGii toxin family protein [bacterium]
MPETEKILKLLSEEEHIKEYVFVGGSALSYYLKHRFSEDIDLAYPEETLKMDNSINKVISNLSKKDISIIEKPESASRHYERIIYANDVKVQFYASNEGSLKTEQYSLKNNLCIADLDALIAMKGMVIHNRSELRDYYDLYALTRTYGIDKVIQETQRFYNTEKLTRFNKANFLQEIVNLSDIKEEKVDSYLKPMYDVTKSDMESFFSEKAKEYISRQMKITETRAESNSLNGLSHAIDKNLNNKQILPEKEIIQNKNKPEIKPAQEIKRKIRR